jgi:hypothetical protein
LENWQIKTVLGLFFGFFFSDIWQPSLFIAAVVLFDLWAKLNALCYQARREYAPNSKWPFVGFIAAWTHDVFDDEPMRKKFFPKVGYYFVMMLLAGGLLKLFKSVEAYMFNEIAYALLIYIVMTEMKSIARNLKASRNPLYRVFAFVVNKYYEKKAGLPLTSQVTQKAEEIIQVEEGKQP